ncbi:MAG: phosphoglycerate mutase family protein [Gracilimonas sp.]
MKKLICTLILIIGLAPAFAQESTKADDITTLIFVRHAEKLDDGTKDPSLNEKGVMRAEKLSDLLQQNYDLKAIYSTGYKRTLETSTPISKKTGLEINQYGLSNPDSLINDIIELHKGQQVLIMGHSNTTPNLVNTALGKQTFDQLDESEYDNIFEVKIDAAGNATVKRYKYWTQGRE